MTDTPRLLDRAAARRHFGLTRVDIDRAFTHLPVVRPPGSRKVYVRAADLERWVDQHTIPAGGRP